MSSGTLVEKHLRGDVLRGAAERVRPVLMHELGETKVGDLNVALVIEQDVLRLHILVVYTLLVQVRKCRRQLQHPLLHMCRILWAGLNLICQGATERNFHDEVKILFFTEQVEASNDVSVPQTLEHTNFMFDILLRDSGFFHGL